MIDLSVQEAAAVTVELANPYWFYPRGLVRRQTCRHAQPVMTQPAIFRCRDDRWVYFALILADEKPWRALVEWMDSEDLAVDLTDPAYDDLVHRQVNFHHVQDVVEVFFLLHDADDVYHEGQRRGLPIGVLNAPEDLYHDEHLDARVLRRGGPTGLRTDAQAGAGVPLLGDRDRAPAGGAGARAAHRRRAGRHDDERARRGGPSSARTIAVHHGRRRVASARFAMS